MSVFCDFLKLKRAEANLTQEDLADYMGVSLMSVQNWESGRTKIQLNRIDKLAEALNADKEELLAKLNDADEDFSNWPAFLFTDEQNEIISKLKLTPEHKKLVMLLRIYNADNWDNLRRRELDWNDNIMKSLQRIPYKYVEDVGVFNLYEMVLHLEEFFKYVPAKFCFDMIRNNPDTAFDFRKLDKTYIYSWFKSYGTKILYDMSGKYIDVNFLLKHVTNFECTTMEFDNQSKFDYYRYNHNPQYYEIDQSMEYITEIFDEETLTVRNELTEKGMQLKEWGKDIDFL